MCEFPTKNIHDLIEEVVLKKSFQIDINSHRLYSLTVDIRINCHRYREKQNKTII